MNDLERLIERVISLGERMESLEVALEKLRADHTLRVTVVHQPEPEAEPEPEPAPEPTPEPVEEPEQEIKQMPELPMHLMAKGPPSEVVSAVLIHDTKLEDALLFPDGTIAVPGTAYMWHNSRARYWVKEDDLIAYLHALIKRSWS